MFFKYAHYVCRKGNDTFYSHASCSYKKLAFYACTNIFKNYSLIGHVAYILVRKLCINLI